MRLICTLVCALVSSSIAQDFAASNQGYDNAGDGGGYDSDNLYNDYAQRQQQKMVGGGGGTKAGVAVGCLCWLWCFYSLPPAVEEAPTEAAQEGD